MFSCGFYNSLNGDRKYSAIQFGEMFDGLITDGIYSTIGEAFGVTPGAGLGVVVGTGRAWFNKTWSVNDAALPLSLEMADLLLPRIDMVVLEVDTRTAVRDNCIKVVTGTPAVTPEKPALVSENGLYQYPLAYISVAANQDTVAKADIENMMGRTPCPFVTGILQSISIDDAFLQWEGQFEEWFANVQAQLSGDIAANLQRQVDELKTQKVNVSDKASAEDIQNGVEGKWVDASTLSKNVTINKPMTIVSHPTGIPLDGSVYPISSDIGSKIYDKFGYAGGFTNIISSLGSPFLLSDSMCIYFGNDYVWGTLKRGSTIYNRTLMNAQNGTGYIYYNGNSNYVFSNIAYAVSYDKFLIFVTNNVGDSSYPTIMSNAIIFLNRTSISINVAPTEIKPLVQPSYTYRRFCGIHVTNDHLYFPIIYGHNTTTMDIYVHVFNISENSIAYSQLLTNSFSIASSTRLYNPFLFNGVVYMNVLTNNTPNVYALSAFDGQRVSGDSVVINALKQYYIRSDRGGVNYDNSAKLYKENKEDFFVWVANQNDTSLSSGASGSIKLDICVLRTINKQTDFKKYTLLTPFPYFYTDMLGDASEYTINYSLSWINKKIIILLFMSNSFSISTGSYPNTIIYSCIISENNPEKMLHTFNIASHIRTAVNPSSNKPDFDGFEGFPYDTALSNASIYLITRPSSGGSNKFLGIVYNNPSFDTVRIPDSTNNGRNDCLLYLEE